MPRTRRTTVGGLCYHSMNRGNRKCRVFHDQRDYRSFVALMERACARIPLRILAWCLMPNHFHLIAWPIHDRELGRWMQWILTTHGRHYHLRYGTSGRVWQGRFKAFVIQHDAHLLTVLRYVERNPLRAGLVERAEYWPWSSLAGEAASGILDLDPGPIQRPVDWIGFVNQPLTLEELSDLRSSSRREAPYGDDEWKAIAQYRSDPN